MISHIISVFKADTSDMKAKLKELRGEEKKLQQASLDATEARNKSIDAWTKGLGKATIAIGVAALATKGAVESIKAYNQQLRLVETTAGISIGKVRDAFGGLVSEMDALSFAAATANGVLALNQGQMETVAKAAVALRSRGFDVTESLKKLQDAAVKGKVNGLDDLGLSIKEGASKAETLRNMMAELNKVIADTGPMSRHVSSVEKLGAQWDNAKQAIKNYVAEALVGPSLLDRVYEKAWGDFMGKFTSANAFANARNQNAIRQFVGGHLKGLQKGQDFETIEMPDMDLSGDAAKRRDAARKRLEAERKAASQRANDWTTMLIDQLEAEGVGIWSAVDGALTSYNDLGAQLPGFEDATRQIKESFERMNAANYETFRAGKQQSFLESSFGKLEEFDAYRAAFDTLTGAVSSSMQAWITDSMSVGQAFKKFIGEALTALASQLGIEALKHGAYALGSLAFGDVRGAGQHGAAAAAFGFGAAAAAAAARAMGRGGTQYGSSGGAGGGSQGGGGRGSGDVVNAPGMGQSRGQRGGRDVIYVVDDPFADMTPRQRALAIEKSMRRSNRRVHGEDE